ncbi:hypothetical protein [Kitasatospora cinereorecta]|uniref:Transglycosylase SLT domain-containing protein n=1 Tax=Kitasatospora cinereorecta TaxID=285560 RepID=A0ABW0VCK5_9ACTN
MALTINQLCDLAKDAGFTGDDIRIAGAVAMAESGGRADAIGDTGLVDAKWGPSIGLFQIRSLRRPQDFGYPDNLRVEQSLSDPEYNTKAAKAIQQQAGNWSAWSTFTNGAYKQYLNGATSSTGETPTTPATDSRIRRCLELLMGENGYREGPNNYNKYAQELIDAGKAPQSWQNDAWCYVFQSWGTWKAGLEDYCLMSNFCPDGVNFFHKKGWWSEYPMVGAEVFYGTAEEQWGLGGTHIERVYQFDADNIWTIGGNTNLTGSSQGDGVYLRGPIPRRGVRVYGYGCPPFPEGRLSADPRWGGRTSAAYTDLPQSSGTSTANGADPRPWVYLGQLEQAIAADVPAPTGHRSYCWPQVLLVEKGLAGEGLLDNAFVDGSWGTLTLKAYSDWQKRLGYSGADADGHPGQASLQKLADKYGFRVGA